MPKKRSSTKQPADDPQLKAEVSDAVADAKTGAKKGNVATADAPTDTLHLRDIRPE